MEILQKEQWHANQEFIILTLCIMRCCEASEIAQWVCRFYEQPKVRWQEKRRSREMTKLWGWVAFFYRERCGLFQEVAQYFQRDLSSLSRQRIALETLARVDPELAAEILHLRQFLNTNMQA